jgi:pimeloyl-ACP methyl ester carboxylesterase
MAWFEVSTEGLMNSTLRGIAVGVFAVVASLTAVSGQPQPAHGYFVTSDGVRIHYLTAGQGSAVVLLHGHGADAHSNWVSTGVVGALASRHRVMAIDLRGHGQSEKPLDAARYGDRLWRDAVELMDHLDIRRTHLHGYSLVSLVAWNVLAQNPSRIASVALGGGGLPEVEPRWIAKLPQDEDARADLRAPLQHRAAAPGAGEADPLVVVDAITAPLRGLEELEYPFHDWTAVITTCGRICYRRRKINVSQVFAGQKVGVKQVDDHIWLVSFMHYDLGYFDDETCRLEPIENPFGPTALPMPSE